jgi:ribonuclease HI
MGRMSERIRIYTDGACSGNPGPGGWGAVIVGAGGRRELSGGVRRTTNNRMEILSVVMALEAVDAGEPVTIVSDSRYVVDMLNGGHVERWARGGWMRDKKHAALNPDLWSRLLELRRGRDVAFEWVRGHNGNPDNARADELAVAARSGDALPVDEGHEAPPLFVGGLFSLGLGGERSLNHEPDAAGGAAGEGAQVAGSGEM